MPVQLPLTPSIAHYRVSTVLDRENYILDIRWNGRGGFWVMDIFTEDETLIGRGLRLVLGSIVGGRLTSANRPPGQFIVSDLTNSGLDATFDDMGTRVHVYYYSESEI